MRGQWLKYRTIEDILNICKEKMWLHSSPTIWVVLHFSEKEFSEAESFWAHVCGTWAGGRALETSRLPLQM